MNQPDMADKDYDRLWKVRSLFDTLNDTYAKLYNPFEHSAVKKLLCYSKGEIIQAIHSYKTQMI
jgi:hypothetical protein